MQTRSEQIALFFIVTTCIVFLLAALIILLLYLYKKHQLRYIEQTETLKLNFEKNLLKAKLEIQEQTLESISREIHDNITLSLTLTKLNLNTINWNSLEYAHNSVSSSIELLSETIDDLRNLSKSISTEVVKSLGLAKAVLKEIERFNKMKLMRITYEESGEHTFMDSEKELIIFRIIQEAFNNIFKHAQASNVNVKFNYKCNYLDILIKDNGVGFSEDRLKNTEYLDKAGLANMQTRAKSFGGNIFFESWPKRGTQILITIPYT
jgi:two-component system, NarL family, sensor kinase